jgi:cell division protein FtsB
VNGRKRPNGVVRLCSRLAVVALGAVVFTLVSIQFARIVNENVAMARSLAGVQHDVADLRTRKREEEREVKRLSDPAGAIPEIHERLHLVGPDEAIIYVKPGSRSTRQ